MRHLSPEWICKALSGLLLVGILASFACGMTQHWWLALATGLLTLLGVLFTCFKALVWWPRFCAKRPRILMLHSVSDAIIAEDSPNISIRPTELERLLEALLQAGYSFRTLRCAMEEPLKERVIVLTFDDGHVDNYTQLFPILKRHQIPATIFVTNRQAPIYLTPSQLREMVASGLIELGGHTVSHASLTECTEPQLKAELEENRAYLQQLSGQAVVSFAYPRGAFGAREQNAVRMAGYRYAVITKKNSPHSGDPLLLPRQTLPRGLSLFAGYLLVTRGKIHL